MVSNVQPLNDSPRVSKRTCSRLLACRGVTETKRAPPRYSTPFKTNGADADEVTLAAVFLTGFFRGFATADDDDGASALLRPARRSAICCFSSSHWPDSARRAAPAPQRAALPTSFAAVIGRAAGSLPADFPRALALTVPESPR